MANESIESLLFDFTDGLDSDGSGNGVGERVNLSAAGDGEAEPVIDNEPACPLPPAEERIRNLFRGLPSQRAALLAVLAAAAEITAADAVNEAVEAAQRHNASVFRAADLCRLLEQAGAIERVDEGGEPLEEAEPEIIVIDGVEYLQPAEPPAVFWRATPEGLAALADDDPQARLADLLASEEGAEEVYLKLLSLMEEADGMKVGDLGEAIADTPFVKSSGLHVTHFLDRLDQAGAVTWDGLWRCTEVGRAACAGMNDER